MPYATYPSRTPPAGLFTHPSTTSPPVAHPKRPSSPGSPPTFFNTPATSSSSFTSPTSPHDTSSTRTRRRPSSAADSSSSPASSPRSLLATSARLTYLSALAATVLCALFHLVLASYVVKLARDARTLGHVGRVRVKRARMHVDQWTKQSVLVGLVARVVPWPLVWVAVQVVKRAGVARVVSGMRTARTAATGADRDARTKHGSMASQW